MAETPLNPQVKLDAVFMHLAHELVTDSYSIEIEIFLHVIRIVIEIEILNID